ncbi:MAG: sigma-70 family RNA polymerase sigma factor [Vulcanimicrobiaceae bacterium]
MLAAIVDRESPSSFEALFALEYGRVVAIAGRVVGDLSDAEDVAQEVFAAFARSRRRADCGAIGWLRTAAVHTALNHVRARKRRLSRELADYRQHRALNESNTRTNDPQVALDRTHQRLLVRTAMLRIESRHAQILALRYGGLSYAEIAATLQIDVAQIGTRLARAERAFRREIERETL